MSWDSVVEMLRTRYRRLTKNIRIYLREIRPSLKAMERAGRGLHVEQLHCDKPHKSRVVMVALHESSHDIQGFLGFHRGQGTGKLVILNCSGALIPPKVLERFDDVVVYRADTLPQDPRRTEDQLNFLIRKHAMNRWCLTLRTNERLRYAYDDHAGVGELVEFLEAEHRKSFHTIAVPVYSDPLQPQVGKGDEVATRSDGQPPYGYFDGSGYVAVYDETDHKIIIQGGVASRVSMPQEAGCGQSLDRISLFKVGKYDFFTKAFRILSARSKNLPVYWHHTTPTGCLEVLAGDEPFALPGAYRDGMSQRAGEWDAYYLQGLISTGQWF